VQGFSHIVVHAHQGAEVRAPSPAPLPLSNATSRCTSDLWTPDETAALFLEFRRLLLLQAALDVNWCLFASRIRLGGVGPVLLRWYSGAARGGAGLWNCDDRFAAATVLINGFEGAHERDRIYQTVAEQGLPLPGDLRPAIVHARAPRAWTVFDPTCDPRYEPALESAATILAFTLFCLLGTVDEDE
jgi:hypothetical protein